MSKKDSRCAKCSKKVAAKNHELVNVALTALAKQLPKYDGTNAGKVVAAMGKEVLKVFDAKYIDMNRDVFQEQVRGPLHDMLKWLAEATNRYLSPESNLWRD